MSSNRRFSFSRVIPDDILASDAISCLHQPSNLIGLSPYVIDYRPLSPTGGHSEASPTTYLISDRVDYLPFGLWTGKISVTVTYTNQDDGVKVHKQPPVGITVQEHWLVRPSSSGAREQSNTAELVLNAELEGNPLVLYLVEGMMKKSLENYVDGMMEVFSKKKSDSASS